MKPSGPVRADACVVGAGPWGLAVARGLLREGAAVVVCDDGAPPAARAAAGMLGRWSEAEEGEDALLALLGEAADAWPGFEDDLFSVTGRRLLARTGTLHVVARPEHRELVRHRLRAIAAARGEAPAWMTAGDLRDAEPGLAPGAGGGFALPDEHQVDPAALLAALCDAAAAAGARFTGPALALRRDATGRVTGVETDGGRVACDRVVLAGGASAGTLDDAVPVRGVKGESLELAPRAGGPCPLRAVVRTPDVYLVPRPDGRVIVGATQDECGDRHPTAGGAHRLLDEALVTAPGLAEMAFVAHRVGLRPTTPDAQPAVGETDDGLVRATGGFRHGVMLAPAVAAEVCRLVAGRPGGERWEPFRPGRFRAVAR